MGGSDERRHKLLDEAQVGTHRDAVANALVYRAPRRVMCVRALGGITLLGRAARQRVVHTDPLDDEHPVFDLDLAFGR
jgi:hypothetical protein